MELELEEADIIKFQRMINGILFNFYLPGWERDDISQEAWLYLLSALQRYDVSKGSRDGFLYLSVKLQLKKLKTMNQYKLSSQYRNAIASYEIEKTKQPNLTTDEFLIKTKMFQGIMGKVKKYLDRHNITPHERYTSLNLILEQNKNFDIHNSADIESELEHEELINLCKKALSPLESAVFFKHMDGYDYDEIAQQMNLPKKNIINANQTARNKLKTVYDDYI